MRAQAFGLGLLNNGTDASEVSEGQGGAGLELGVGINCLWSWATGRRARSSPIRALVEAEVLWVLGPIPSECFLMAILFT